MKEYVPNIGLEVHVQLNTRTKAFSAELQEFGAEPNSRVSEISIALPGTLPRLNETHLHHAVKLGLACHCTINRESSFDRKNYSYPDLPKSYQITQDRKPICLGGSFRFFSAGQVKTIRLHHIHMEEDAGKSIHDRHEAYSLVDLNRAGTCLVEIVTEPDFESADEVHDFIEALQVLIRHLEISDANMEEGSLRADLNVSLRDKKSTSLGVRSEVKNINSKKFARQAINYEIERQKKILMTGGIPGQETRQFDPIKGTTSTMRKKEDALDYRYFPEPDLLSVKIDQDYLDSIASEIAPLPFDYESRLVSAYNINHKKAALISRKQDYRNLVTKLIETGVEASDAVDLIVNQGGQLKLERYKDTKYLVEQLNEMAGLIKDGKLSASTAYAVLIPLLDGHRALNVQQLAKEENILIETDAIKLDEYCMELIEAFPNEKKAYQKGKKKLIGFFMGQLMRSNPGLADPKEVKKCFEKILNSQGD